MDISVYKFIHIVALITLFFSLGGLIQGAWLTQNRVFAHKRIFILLHGVGMLLILVSGFGQLARLGMTGSWPLWVTIKLIIWLMLGLIITPIMRKPVLNYYIWPLVVLLGMSAVYLVLFKPF